MRRKGTFIYTAEILKKGENPCVRWKAKIIKACRAAGTYKEYFDPVINTLAEILEKRDAAQQEFMESGARIMIEYTNKFGATNHVQNPLVRVINDLNRDALTYWKELGLTAASLKKINESAIKGSSELSPLDKALMEFGG